MAFKVLGYALCFGAGVFSSTFFMPAPKTVEVEKIVDISQATRNEYALQILALTQKKSRYKKTTTRPSGEVVVVEKVDEVETKRQETASGASEIKTVTQYVEIEKRVELAPKASFLVGTVGTSSASLTYGHRLFGSSVFVVGQLVQPLELKPPSPMIGVGVEF